MGMFTRGVSAPLRATNGARLLFETPIYVPTYSITSPIKDI